MRSIFNDQEKKYIRTNYRTMSYAEIARYLHKTESQVKGWVNHNCETKLRQFNKAYFRTIDTADKAYWLGFIYADGWVRHDTQSRNYELGIQLQQLDAQHLERFNRAIGGVHKVTYHTRTKYICGFSSPSVCKDAVLRIYSKEIVEDLIRHGVVERKTQSSVFPRIGQFFMDFLRGYFDGDGCLYVAPKVYKTQLSIIASHADVLQYIADTLMVEYGITARVYQENELKYALRVWGSDLHKLLDRMYYSDDVVCLDRKKLKMLTYYNRLQSNGNIDCVAGKIGEGSTANTEVSA